MQNMIQCNVKLEWVHFERIKIFYLWDSLYNISATENATKTHKRPQWNKESFNVCRPACLLKLLLRTSLEFLLLQYRYIFCFEFLIFFDIFPLEYVYVCIHMCLNVYGEKKRVSWVLGFSELVLGSGNPTRMMEQQALVTAEHLSSTTFCRL